MISVNDKYAGKDVVSEFINPDSKVKFIIVAEKLQTGMKNRMCIVTLLGFDAPPLAVLYIDKAMKKDATIVQTLGRLSRVAKVLSF